MKIALYCTGYCMQREALSLQGSSWRSVPFPALFALIEHPEHGLILFDTGYSERFASATDSFPYRLYRWTTPVVTAGYGSAAELLEAKGYRPSDVRMIVVSHFHADHICGLSDFPNAQFVCSRKAYLSVKGLTGFAAVKRAYLPGLLPPDFEERACWTEELKQVDISGAFMPLRRAFDVLGDGSLLVVDLPGHASHQIGLLVKSPSGEADVLLGADASWSMQAVRENRPPHPLAYLVIDEAKPFKETFRMLVALHRSNPELRMLFTHCHKAWQQSVDFKMPPPAR
ncbi:MBL fold metallo-hydrolase [Paenibacillaceae bacterium]|nr:MBL fold metallo-hydrolase [Paenibacillaceae bacterium]